MLVSMASIPMNAASSFTMVRVLHLGHAGLALSLSLVSTVNVVILLALIGRRIGGIRGREIALSLMKILIAAALMGAVCLFIVHASDSRAVHVFAGIPAGALAFYAAASALRIPELAETRGIIAGKLRRKTQHVC